MKSIDCLFIHCPKFNNYYKPLNNYIFINYMPMGLFALADYLSQNGFSSKILHLGVQYIADRNFSMIDYIAKRGVRMIAMPLHWHQQSYDVIETATKIKRKFPDIFIVLGGYTASFYSREIVEGIPAVDAVIRGDGEIPLLKLASAIVNREGKMEDIPNLVWRNNSDIVLNPFSYVGTEDILNQLRFTNFLLMENYQIYIKYISFPYFYVKGRTKEDHYRYFTLKSPLFPLEIGRGCPGNCTYCSGGFISQRTISNRHTVVFRSLDKVLTSIKEALNYGYETMYTAFDPHPRNQTYYINLFKEMREKKIKCEWIFDCFGLPTQEFIDAFHETFPGEKSIIAISPEVGSEEVRKANKTFFYSNNELMECLQYLEKKNVKSDVYFSYGLPFETEDDLMKTKNLISLIRRRFAHVQAIRTHAIEIEPGSPWHLEPDRFGIKTTLKKFEDFYKYHGRIERTSHPGLGYVMPSFFNDKKEIDEKEFEHRLSKIKCRHFCFMHPNIRRTSSPIWGRIFCNLFYLLNNRLRRSCQKATMEGKCPR